MAPLVAFLLPLAATIWGADAMNIKNYPPVPIEPKTGIVRASSWTCNNAGPFNYAACSTVDVSKLTCGGTSRGTSSKALGCGRVLRSHFVNLQSMMCPANGGTVALPSCIRIAPTNINGKFNPDILANSGQLPTNIVVTDASIKGIAAASALQPGPLPENIRVRGVNVMPGIIDPTTKIAGGPLNPAIKIAATSIKDGTITQARIDDNVVPLPVKFTVSDANIDDASITTDALSPGDLAPTVDVNNDNVAAGSLALEKFSCNDDANAPIATPLDMSKCLKTNPSNLVCPTNKNLQPGSVPLPSCVEVDGRTQISGDIAASQVGTTTDSLLSNANLNANAITCLSGQAAAPFGQCINADASKALVCPVPFRSHKLLRCIALNGAHVSGTVTNATVDGSQLRGLITGNKTSFDGTRIVAETVPGSALRKVWTGSNFRKTINFDYSQSGYVGMCCPVGSLPTACNAPILTNVQNSPTVFVDRISVGPDNNAAEPNGQSCCHYNGIWTSQQDPISAVIQINCLPVAAVLPTSDIKATVYVSYSRRRRDVPRAIEH